MDLNYSKNTTAVHVTYTLTSIRRIETFQKKRKHNIERRSHAGPVLKLSRHGIHGCVVDSQFSNPPLVISNKNRGEPGIASISMRAHVRSSILLSRISAVIDEARERRDRSEDSAGNCDSQESFCQGYRSVEPRNERVISTNRFPTVDGSLAIFWKETRDSVEYAEARRVCVAASVCALQGWPPEGKQPYGCPDGSGTSRNRFPRLLEVRSGRIKSYFNVNAAEAAGGVG